jgi:hypothetical protein
MQNEKIGSTIRDIAKAFMILQSIASIILGIILCVILGKNNLGEVGIISLVVIACGGMWCAYVANIIMVGFGQLVDDTMRIRNTTDKLSFEDIPEKKDESLN